MGTVACGSMDEDAIGSQLDRAGVFRFNIGVSRPTFRKLISTAFSDALRKVPYTARSRHDVRKRLEPILHRPRHLLVRTAEEAVLAQLLAVSPEVRPRESQVIVVDQRHLRLVARPLRMRDALVNRFRHEHLASCCHGGAMDPRPPYV